MIIRWLGHACFALTARQGTRILTDPYHEGTGYLMPAVNADFITVSHAHADHNTVEAVSGTPTVVREAGPHTLGAFKVRTVATHHDDQCGAKRGPNLVFVFDDGEVRVAHLGDLGHLLTPAQVQEIGPIDVLLVPVGGHYTVDGRQAAEVVRQLVPKLVIPMHYKTAASTSAIRGPEEFLEAAGLPVERAGGTALTVAPPVPAGPRIVLLDYI